MILILVIKQNSIRISEIHLLNCMKKLYLILAIVGAMLLKVASDFDAFKTLSPVRGYTNCHYLSEDIVGPEDMTMYKNNILLIGSGDYDKLWAKGAPIKEQLGIYAVYNSNHKDFRVKKLPIANFPQDIALYVHGISVRE